MDVASLLNPAGAMQQDTSTPHQSPNSRHHSVSHKALDRLLREVPAAHSPERDPSSPASSSHSQERNYITPPIPVPAIPQNPADTAAQVAAQMRSTRAKKGWAARKAKKAAAAGKDPSTVPMPRAKPGPKTGSRNRRARNPLFDNDFTDGSELDPDDTDFKPTTRIPLDKTYNPVTDRGMPSVVVTNNGEEELDDRLYCICQKLYDPLRIMIACDRCDNWYHIDCVRLPSTDLELVDMFFCPKCEQETAKPTTWKQRCSRPTCNSPALNLSKYCSDWCGLTVAAERLLIATQNRDLDLENVYHSVIGASRSEGSILTVPHSRTTKKLTDTGVVEITLLSQEQHPSVEHFKTLQDDLKSLRAELSEITNRRSKIEASLQLINTRLQYLELATTRWEILCESYESSIPPTTTTAAEKKRKGKKSSNVVDLKPCGFDVRLVWDDSEWLEWVDSVEGRRCLEGETGEVDEEVVCVLSRKRCDRHVGWAETRQADFQVEIAVQTRKLDQLAEKERSIRRSIESYEERQKWVNSSRKKFTLKPKTEAFKIPTPKGENSIVMKDLHSFDEGASENISMQFI